MALRREPRRDRGERRFPRRRTRAIPCGHAGEILLRFATEAASFAAFKRETESFFLSTNEPANADWHVAVDRVRTYKECLGDLPIRSAASRVFVDVIEKKIDQVMPSDNTVSADLAKAAA